MKELNEWEKRLRDQVRDWDDPLPPDGWQRLSRMLPGHKAVRTRLARRRWLLAVLPAAAAVAALLYIVLPPWQSGEQPRPHPTRTTQHPIAAIPSAQAAAGHTAGQARAEIPVRFASPPPPHRADANNAPATDAVPTAALMAFAAPAAPADTSAARDAAPAPTARSHAARRKRDVAKRKFHVRMQPSSKPAASPRLSLAVEGGPAAGKHLPGYIAAPDGLLAANGQQTDAPPTVSPVVGENLRQPTASRIRHRLPLQFTAGADFPLTQRLTLGSGISYTRLTTDIEGGSTTAFYRTRQYLHYIGVPLRLGYTFARTSFADFYANAETRIALCVGARQETDFIVKDGPAPPSTTAHDGRGLWQGSFTISAGAELHLGRRAGLFVEPGVTYALPDGSTLPTPYHDHPFRFSLQAGLRWKLR